MSNQSSSVFANERGDFVMLFVDYLLDRAHLFNGVDRLTPSLLDLVDDLSGDTDCSCHPWFRVFREFRLDFDLFVAVIDSRKAAIGYVTTHRLPQSASGSERDHAGMLDTIPHLKYRQFARALHNERLVFVPECFILKSVKI